jgi:PhnB protein
VAITPYLLYEDVAAAMAWLAKAFGFTRTADIYKDADGIVTHASMRFDGGTVMMGHPGPTYRNPRRLGRATQMLYIDVANVDRHFARAKKAGATVLHAPEDTFYGHRRYGVADPEGHQWYFAQQIAAPPRRAAARKAAKKKASR